MNLLAVELIALGVAVVAGSSALASPVLFNAGYALHFAVAASITSIVLRVINGTWRQPRRRRFRVIMPISELLVTIILLLFFFGVVSW